MDKYEFQQVIGAFVSQLCCLGHVSIDDALEALSVWSSETAKEQFRSVVTATQQEMALTKPKDPEKH